MSGRQKIIISVTAVVLVFAVIGLAIALVLAANNVEMKSTMSVEFTSYEVSATIGCSAHLVQVSEDNINGSVVADIDHPQVISPEGGTLTFEAGGDTKTETVEFGSYVYDNAEYRVRYEFVITNTGAKVFDVVCSKPTEVAAENNMSTFLRNSTDNVDESDGTLSFRVAPQEVKTIYLFVYVTDPAQDGTFDSSELGALAIAMTGTNLDA